MINISLVYIIPHFLNVKKKKEKNASLDKERNYHTSDQRSDSFREFNTSLSAFAFEYSYSIGNNIFHPPTPSARDTLALRDLKVVIMRMPNSPTGHRKVRKKRTCWRIRNDLLAGCIKGNFNHKYWSRLVFIHLPFTLFRPLESAPRDERRV